MFILVAFIALLLLATIPLTVVLTRTYASHQVSQLKRSQALSIAETGISYASHELNGSTDNGTTWTLALQNNFVGAQDCNAANVNLPGGGQVKLTCIAYTPAGSPLAPDLERYQVAVIATAYMPRGQGSNDLVPTRAKEAYLSRRTLGITLPDGTQAGAALQLARVPTSNQSPAALGLNALIVHWGPIVCYQLTPPVALPLVPPGPTIDPAAWSLKNPLDETPLTQCPNPAGGGSIFCQGYPRKFSDGGLTGSAVPLRYPRQADSITLTTVSSTDNLEWWAYASLQVPPHLDLLKVNDPIGSYENIAETQKNGVGPTVAGISDDCGGVGIIYTNGNHITGPPACTIDLAAATNMLASTVLFIDGSNVHISKKPITGTLIVTKNLTIDTVGGVPTGANQILNVPTSAYKEYLAITSLQTSNHRWPCGNIDTKPTSVGTTCNSAGGGAGVGPINFTGFLYVGGNMTVNAHWVMNGALSVGDLTRQYLVGDNPPTGQLIIPAAGRLTLLYDAPIAHSIAVLSNELQIDRVQETTPQ